MENENKNSEPNPSPTFCIHGKQKDPEGHKVTCETCKYIGMYEHYKQCYETSLANENEMRKLVNFYKTLMFTVDVGKEQVEKNILEMSEALPFESSLLPMIPTWEKLDPEVIYEAVRLHEMLYNKFSEIAFKTKSKSEIKIHLEKKTKRAMEETLAESKEREQKKEEKVKALTPYWKLVAVQMKTLKISETDAVVKLQALGITQESMKGQK